MPKPIESLTGTDATAFQEAITPHVAAVLDANGYSLTVELAAEIAGDADQIAADKLIIAGDKAAAAESAADAATVLAALQSVFPDFGTDPAYIPLFFDEDWNVPVWLADGKISGTGLGSAMVTQIGVSFGIYEMPPVYPDFVPATFDEADNVPTWTANGVFDSPAAGPTMVAGLGGQLAPRNISAVSSLPICTDGRNLKQWRRKLGKIAAGQVAQANITLLGDSWIQKTEIAKAFYDTLVAKWGTAGPGFLAMHNVSGQYQHPLATVGYTFSAGWTEYDANTSGAPVAGIGSGWDGLAFSTALTTATLAWTGVNATDLKIFYAKTAGTFRWRVDGGAWTAVTGDGSNALGVVTIAGLAAAAHTIDIDTTGNAGTAVIYGVYAWKSAGTGVIVNKVGNHGLAATSLGYYSANYIEPMASQIPTDLLIIFMSTNDYATSASTPASLIAQYATAVAKVRVGSPNCGVVIVAPPRSGLTVVTPQTKYRDAFYASCIANGYEFYNGHDLWDDWATENAAGLWADTAHLVQAGANCLVGGIINNLLQP